jgi:HlyD family secretion protein
MNAADHVVSAPAASLVERHRVELGRLLRAATLVVGLGLLPLLAWVSWAPLASAVVAPAVLKAELNRSPVQHADGGIVREVKVRNGQRVREGEALIVLGDVSVDADMQRWDKRVRSESASIARLEAEQALRPVLTFPPPLTDAARADAGLAELLDKERALFSARRSALNEQSALLRTQREKVAQEVQALKAQIERAGESLRLQRDELRSHGDLLKDGFVSAARVTQIEAQVADYGVKLEERRSELARAEQHLVDSDLRLRALENEYRQQASDQLKVITARLAEIQQEQRKTGDASRRQVIAAPVDGEVIDLRVTAPGAVISPRDVVAEIVPSRQQLVLEARLRPEDIDRVRRGQAAEIRFTAFSSRSTKLVHGKVSYVSADRLVDRQTGMPFYVAQVEADATSLAAAGDLKLVAGMPGEVYLNGETRTVLQYLLEPLTQLTLHAARER